MEIKIVTINCFDSPLSHNRNARIDALVQEIITLKPEIVFLQEIIFSKTATRIANFFQDKGYQVFYNTDLIFNKGGLFTASKLTHNRHKYTRFPNQGKLLSLQITDRIIGKGYQQITISYKKKHIELFNVHLVSVYDNHSRGERKTLHDQLEILSQKLAKIKNIILCGDLNFSPKNILYSKILESTKLIDPLSKMNPITVSRDNTNRQGLYGNDSNVKLDYTFVSKKLSQGITSQVIFNNLFRINGQNIHLSDHFGLLTTIEI